jgi:hypothetical protein
LGNARLNTRAWVELRCFDERRLAIARVDIHSVVDVVIDRQDYEIGVDISLRLTEDQANAVPRLLERWGSREPPLEPPDKEAGADR